MSEYVLLCDECHAIYDCEEFCVGVPGPFRCDRCGKTVDSYHPHPVNAKHIWPRAIPVSERLPDEIRVWIFEANIQQWIDGVYDPKEPGIVFYGFEDGGLDCEIPLRNVTHWLPMPPKP